MLSMERTVTAAAATTNTAGGITSVSQLHPDVTAWDTAAVSAWYAKSTMF